MFLSCCAASPFRTRSPRTQVRMDHTDISGCAVEPGPVHHFHSTTQSGETLRNRFGGLDPRKSALWEVPVALRDRWIDGSFCIRCARRRLMAGQAWRQMAARPGDAECVNHRCCSLRAAAYEAGVYERSSDGRSIVRASDYELPASVASAVSAMFGLHGALTSCTGSAAGTSAGRCARRQPWREQQPAPSAPANVTAASWHRRTA